MRRFEQTGILGYHQEFVDLRSDTVTKPTDAMYPRMCLATLGDDGLDGDPTVIELEEMTAQLLGKEASLFVPSCTMANLLAILTQARRADQVVLEQNSHIFLSESGASIFGGIKLRPIFGERGAMADSYLEEILVEGRERTSLICLETSHNNSGGAVLSVGHIDAITKMAKLHGASVHLDGARLFNAVAAVGVEASVIAAHFDTVSVCLSKGLSAPAGALLVGSAKVTAEARRLRKFIGGTQRQVGVVAAAGIEALANMRGRLMEDNAQAKYFSAILNAAGVKVQADIPETNIVHVDVTNSGMTSAEWIECLGQRGVKVRALNNQRLRCVTHRHIDKDATERAAAAFIETASR